MPVKFEIMRALCEGLNSLEIDKPESRTEWNKAVKTELCKIGRRFGYSVYARSNEVNKAYRDEGEWLYDVTWLEYEKGARGELVNLVDAPLVAECEGGNKGDIEDDFEKLLLARPHVRLMIFKGISEPDSKRGSPNGLPAWSGSSTAPAPRMPGCWRPGKKVRTIGRSGISRLR